MQGEVLESLSLFSPLGHHLSCSTVFSIAPQLVGVEVVAALDLYVEQGQWDKCIETATKQVLVSPSYSQLSLPFALFPHLLQSCLSLNSTNP
jgi:hypothetical protein